MRSSALYPLLPLLAVLACGGKNGGPTGPESPQTPDTPESPETPAAVARVRVTPADAALFVGQTLELAAVAEDAAGNVLADRPIAWASSDPATIAVSGAGAVTALAEGRCTIRATSEGVTGSAELSAGVPALEVASATSVPGRTGMLYQPAPRVRALLDGAPVEGYPIAWERESDGSGWLFPVAPATDAGGYARAHWAPGPDASQTITARGLDTSTSLSFEAEPVPGKSGAGVWVCGSDRQGGELADGFRVTLNAAADPYYTYYAAMQFAHGYMGYQATTPFDPARPPTYYHNEFEKLIIFSVWDEDGVEASLQEAGVAECRDFVELDGHGVQCTLPYPWRTGEPYTFELRQTDGDTWSEYETWFTDEAAGERMMFARIRLAPAHNRCFATWIEDFGPEASSCLDVELRDYTLSDPQRRVDGAWEPMTQVLAENPVADRCANHSIVKVGDGVRITAGDTIFQAPFESTWIELP